VRILLVEDNEMNRDLARRVLAKRGHDVTVAVDGEQAVALHAAQPDAFDVVLMDLHMPRLDGYDASAAIRRAEASGDRHVPILAMTAHTEHEVIARVLAAGMDGHIGKPIDVPAMLAALARVAADGAAGPAGQDAPVEPARAAGAGSGWNAVVALLGGDVALAEQVSKTFFVESDAIVPAMRAAIARTDAAALEREAHKLRGVIGSFGEGPALEAARVLEEIGASGALAEAAPAFDTLAHALRGLRAELETGMQAGAS
jgi:CheY-like chemotaxis protein